MFEVGERPEIPEEDSLQPDEHGRLIRNPDPFTTDTERKLPGVMEELKDSAPYKEKYEGETVQQLHQAIDIIDKLINATGNDLNNEAFKTYISAQEKLKEQLKLAIYRRDQGKQKENKS